jgi:hypothetical protein
MTNRVQIFYKSGNSIVITAEKFKTTRSPHTGELTGIEWGGVTPNILFPGINEIEAIFDLGEVEAEV